MHEILTGHKHITGRIDPLHIVVHGICHPLGLIGEFLLRLGIYIAPHGNKTDKHQTIKSQCDCQIDHHI